MKRSRRRIDFTKINRAALDVLPALLGRLCRTVLGGKTPMAGNPHRDRSHSAVAPK
jgi:hypothetical protein